jgi:uncharacterized DUF497 family protein
MDYLFEWDKRKETENKKKHGIAFTAAMEAFRDPNRVMTNDPAHSIEENRYFCYGKVEGEVLTVRFTYRGKKVRIIGVAYWRKGKKIYAQKNKLRK